MELLVVILLAVAVIAIAIAGMAISILLKKNGKFPNTHVSGNKYLKSQGIFCAQTQDKLAQREGWKKVKYDKLKFVTDIKADK